MHHISYQTCSPISMVSFFPRDEYARRFYRQLEIEKSIALKMSGWKFESDMTLSETAKKDLVDSPCPNI